MFSSGETKEEHGIAGASLAEEVLNLITGQKHFLCEQSMRRLELFNLEKRCGDLTTPSSIWRGPTGKLDRDFFIRNYSDRARTKGVKLKEEK